MGYYTRFTIDVQGDGPVLDRFKADLDAEKPLCAYGELTGVAEVHINGKGYTDYADTCKWYDYPEDMKNISKDYPNLLFVLNGEGEESGDLWRAYYRNGESQDVRAKIVFDEPDLDKLPLIDEVEMERLNAKVEELKLQQQRIDVMKADLQLQEAEVQEELDRLRSK